MSTNERQQELLELRKKLKRVEMERDYWQRLRPGLQTTKIDWKGVPTHQGKPGAIVLLVFYVKHWVYHTAVSITGQSAHPAGVTHEFPLISPESTFKLHRLVHKNISGNFVSVGQF